MSHPSQLELILEHALKGVDVVILNRGVSGEMAEDTAERIRSEVALRNPDLVLWQLGTNDALARIPPRDFEDTVRSTIRWLKENRIDVVLVGVQYTTRLARDENYVAIRDSLQKIAAEENILYVRRYDAMRFIAQTRANLQLMAGDNFHLNDLGYRCMAEHIAHAMIVSLFVFEFRTFPKGTNSLCADSPLRPEGGIQTEPLPMKFNGQNLRAGYFQNPASPPFRRRAKWLWLRPYNK